MRYKLPFPVKVTRKWWEPDFSTMNYAAGKEKSLTQNGAYVETHHQAWGNMTVMDVIDTEECVIRPKHFKETYLKIHALWLAGKLEEWRGD